MRREKVELTLGSVDGAEENDRRTSKDGETEGAGVLRGHWVDEVM